MKKYECYCCKKEFEEKEGNWVRATVAKILRDKTKSENRFVCKSCNHLKVKNESS